MPDVLISAIARTDDVAKLEDILTRCDGLETSRITVFKKDAVGKVPAPLRMHFIPFRGSPVASGTHGTNVPGMGITLALDAYAADTCINHLKDIGIPCDAAHYYNIAIEEGRSVLTYVTSTEDATLIEEQFRVCGFVKIRRFPSAEKVLVASGAGLQ